MASHDSPVKTYMSDEFVESVGVVLVHQSHNTVIFLRDKHTGDRLIPKGRLNIGESRAAAAIREVKEETGYTCNLVPFTLRSRQPSGVDGDGNWIRNYVGRREPFMVTHALLHNGVMKMIWWYLGEVNESVPKEPGEERFEEFPTMLHMVDSTLTRGSEQRVADVAMGIAVHVGVIRDSREVARGAQETSNGH